PASPRHEDERDERRPRPRRREVAAAGERDEREAQSGADPRSHAPGVPVETPLPPAPTPTRRASQWNRGAAAVSSAMPHLVQSVDAYAAARRRSDLAVGADPRAAPAGARLLDRVAAARAGLARAAVDAELGLHPSGLAVRV